MHEIELSARNLTSDTGQFLLLEHARNHDLAFENAFTNKIKMNHIKNILYGNVRGIDKPERLKQQYNDPLIREFGFWSKIQKRYPDSWENFSSKTTQEVRRERLIVSLRVPFL